MIDQILEKYPNKVKVVIKNFPLTKIHGQAYKAAQYSLAAHKQGKYKEMYHAIFENYKLLKTNEDLPLELATNIIPNMNQFIKDVSSAEIKAQIDLEMKQFRTSGIPRLAVPKFLIQGKEVSGGRDIASFSAAIDAELKKLK